MKPKQHLLVLIISFLVGGSWVGGRAWWEKQSTRAHLQEQAIWLARRIPDEALADRNADVVSSLKDVPPEEWTEVGFLPGDPGWHPPQPGVDLPDVVLLSPWPVGGQRMAVMRDRSVRWIDQKRTVR